MSDDLITYTALAVLSGKEETFGPALLRLLHARGCVEAGGVDGFRMLRILDEVITRAIRIKCEALREKLTGKFDEAVIAQLEEHFSETLRRSLAVLQDRYAIAS